MARGRSFLRSPSRYLPQRSLRYLVVALIIVFVFYSFSSDKFPSSSIHERPTWQSPHKIQASFPLEPSADTNIRLQRREQVKAAFKHAWKGYKEHAWLHDEVRPTSGGNRDNFVGWAATLVDSLDTLWIMDLKDEFEDALKALEKVDFSKPNAERVPVFETTIRYLGGLLGAWDISGHQYPILLKKAEQLGNFLYQAFDTESGIPVPYYWWERHNDGKMKGENGVLVAQIASLSLEFIRLSQVTGNKKYAVAVQKITDQMEQTQSKTVLPGMWPSKVDIKATGLSFSSHSFTLGAFAGSFPLLQAYLASASIPSLAGGIYSLHQFHLYMWTLPYLKQEFY